VELEEQFHERVGTGPVAYPFSETLPLTTVSTTSERFVVVTQPLVAQDGLVEEVVLSSCRVYE